MQRVEPAWLGRLDQGGLSRTWTERSVIARPDGLWGAFLVRQFGSRDAFRNLTVSAGASVICI